MFFSFSSIYSYATCANVFIVKVSEMYEALKEAVKTMKSKNIIGILFREFWNGLFRRSMEYGPSYSFNNLILRKDGKVSR